MTNAQLPLGQLLVAKNGRVLAAVNMISVANAKVLVDRWNSNEPTTEWPQFTRFRSCSYVWVRYTHGSEKQEIIPSN